ncbi:hypothetical protein LOD99_2898 [Oopsacas minuta]|uniref:Uncharacterized protein n=1 Tax=Oopsacas minuta TaxID=111878 RepID=A0AAV7JYR0_9METZ|nr:hypothetical protein LOD99_2898 [Oopsacas minuta]
MAQLGSRVRVGEDDVFPTYPIPFPAAGNVCVVMGYDPDLWSYGLSKEQNLYFPAVMEKLTGPFLYSCLSSSNNVLNSFYRHIATDVYFVLILMERFRTEVRHTKVEPKNYIALNRKKACAKNSSKPIPIPQTIKPVIGDKRISLLARKERHENTVYNSGVKRSLEQLASIISSGDLEKIIQLAKGIQSTTQVGTQPNHLSPQTELEDRVISQTHVIPPVKIVEPSNIPGLNLDSENTHTRLIHKYINYAGYDISLITLLCIKLVTRITEFGYRMAIG